MTRAVPQADEIRNILEQGLAKSEVVVLLQTEGCLTRPWVLLELYEATRRRIPIIPVQLAGKGYDFKAASDFLDNLEVTLEKANPGATAAIEAYLRGSSDEAVRTAGLAEVKAAAQAVPKLISVNLDPEGSQNQITAALRDIVQKASTKRQDKDHKALHPAPSTKGLGEGSMSVSSTARSADEGEVVVLKDA